jgi:3-deoxy-7-phosphoheptulonate synthase
VGKKHLVAPMARAAVAAGADAVMIDVHHDPEGALCDGPQALLPEEMESLGKELTTLAEAMGRPVNRPA